jgi:hypothetical protein
MIRTLAARKRLIEALGYGKEMDDAGLMQTAAIHLEQINEAIALPEYLPSPPGLIIQGRDFLSPKLEVDPDGIVVVSGGDEACYLTPDFRLGFKRFPEYPLPWSEPKE